MAKKRIVEVGKFAVNDMGCELKAKVTFSLKMFEGDTPQEHVANIDLSIDKAKLIDLAMSTIVIDLQKRCRELENHGKVRDLTKNTLHKADIWPGKRTVSVARDMTPEQIRAKAKSDPVFRKALMAELAEMEDEDMASNAA